jgi:hypothetical protein
MIYPNIQIITDKDSLYFCDSYNQSKFFKTDRCNYLRNKLKLKEKQAIVILSQDYNNIHLLVKFLLLRKINYIYFYIDDVFRIQNSEYNVFDISHIESSIEDTKFSEIEIVKKIINLTKIKKYKLFHCEVISKILKKQLKLKIDYHDLFLLEWIRINKNVSLNNFKKFDYKVSCFNHRYDHHRFLMCSLFYQNDNFMYTLCEKVEYQLLLDNKPLSFDKFDVDLRQKLLEQSKKLNQEKLKVFEDEIYESSSNTTLLGKSQHSTEVLFNINKSFVNLVTETRFASPMQYISEKSLKPIIAKRPFIILGPPGNLNLLKLWGFKTFDNWWDESYDLEKNHHLRFKKIYQLTSKILSMTYKELEILLNEMQDVLEYNYETLKKIDYEFSSSDFNSKNTFSL